MSKRYQSTKEFLAAWVAAVNGGDLEGVLGLYGEKAVLLPTFSSEVMATPDQIRGYFENVSSNDSVEVVVREDTVICQEGRGGSAILGVYDWLIVNGEERREVAARFSYLVELSADAPILHHHSSALPGGE